jgi:ubiquinone/menaquinone biosynthesis C-methylase UbiE
MIPRMTETQPEPDWSAIAEWYDGLLQAGSGPHETAIAALLGLTPELEGARVVDVACGQGLASRALAEAGAAAVVGVDAAPAMIDLARERTAAELPVSWRVDDAQRLASLESASFDGATCQLGLMDIPDLPATLRAIRRVLIPGGWFVFIIGHPCFLAPHALTHQDGEGRLGRLISRYLASEFWRSTNPSGVRGKAGNHHRPLSVYLNALRTAGFLLDAVDEPAASPLLAHQQPVYTNVPIFFAARALVN